jgi:hypothetical protein
MGAGRAACLVSIWRRIAGIALFDGATCREILDDPYAVYQGVAVLAAALVFELIWQITLSGSDVISSRDGLVGVDHTVAWGMIIAALRLLAGWAIAVVTIMLLGSRVLQANSRPTRRSFITVWGFAQAPAILGVVVGLTFSSVGYDNLANIGGWVLYAVVIGGTMWSIAVEVHAVRHAFGSTATFRASALVVGRGCWGKL